MNQIEHDQEPTVVDADLTQPGSEDTIIPAVLMIRPARFASNPQTAESNAFQTGSEASDEAEIQGQALKEFESLVARLRRADVEVIVFDDTVEPHTPDAVFPNNWISTHEDGTVVLYSMCAENRRPERRQDIVDALQRGFGFDVRRLLDLSENEADGRFLEGTGSLVLDRENHIAYACISARTDPALAEEFARLTDHELILFEAVDQEGRAIYHTNVMMCIGEGFAVVCSESIRDPEQRQRVLQRLSETGHELVEISYDQMAAFAGNMLEVRTRDMRPLLVMSESAEASLDDAQRRALSRHARILASPIPVIEANAGGSVRCMIAEVRLPRTRAT